MAASSRAAVTLRLLTMRDSSSAASPSPAAVASRSPMLSSRATAAQLWRETTWERIFASRPSEASGYRSYSSFAIASSSTLSPRNSSRSYDDARSGAHEVCVSTCSRRSRGSCSIRRASRRESPVGAVALLVRGDVVDGLPHGRDLLGVIVRDLDPELILELHDQLDEIERVCVQVLLERRLLGDLRVLDAELLRQNFLHPLEDFFTRRCQNRLLAVRGRESARSYSRLRRPFRQTSSQAADDIVLDAAGREMDRARDRAARGVAVCDHREAAQPEQVGASVRVRIELAAQPARRRPDQQPAQLPTRRRGDLFAERVEHRVDRPLEELERDVAREAVADDDVGRPGKQVPALGVAGELELAGREERMCFERQLVSLLGLLADRE